MYAAAIAVDVIPRNLLLEIDMLVSLRGAASAQTSTGRAQCSIARDVLDERVDCVAERSDVRIGFTHGTRYGRGLRGHRWGCAARD
jgi:hypothetical protein